LTDQLAQQIGEVLRLGEAGELRSVVQADIEQAPDAGLP
jgi:hypothetical protein